MKSAAFNFLIVIWILTIAAFFGWSYARHKGLTNAIRPPLNHPFLETLRKPESFAFVAYPPASLSANELIGFLEKAASARQDIILWVDSRPRFDGTLVLARNEAETESAPLLSESLNRWPGHRMILNFRGHRPKMAESVAKEVQKAGVESRVLIQSPEDGLLKDLRQEYPLWIYGTSLAQVTRLFILSSVGLESLSSIRGDAVVIEDKTALWKLDQTAMTEAHRRKLKVFAGPVQTREQIRKIRALGIDGILLERPEEIADLEKDRSAP